jgi:hypothetical protein
MKIRHTLILLALFLFGSCEKEDPVDNHPIAILIVDNAEVATYGVASMRVENHALKKESYEATIGGKNITVGADKDTGTLAFLVPALEEGTHTLAILLEGADYTVDFKVKVTQLAEEPDQVIGKALDDLTFTNTELDRIQTSMKGLDGTEFSEDNTAMLKRYTHSVMETVAGLNQEQKKELAAFISANPLLFAPAEDPTLFMDRLSFRQGEESPEETLDALFVRMEQDKKRLFAITVLTIGAGAAGQPWLAAIAGLAGIYKIYELNNRNITGLNKALMRFGEMLVDESSFKKAASMFTFHKDKKYLVRVNSPYRNPNSSDMQTKSPLIQSIIVSLNEVSDVWIKANNFISKFGFTLKGNAHHIKNVTQAKSKTLEVDPSLLVIANISNSKVKGKWSLSPEGWLIEFTTEEVTPQEFTFDIMYKSATGESTLKYEATLDPESRMFGWYVGKYELHHYIYLPGCSPQAGEKGDVFFYFTPTKLVTYTRSILEGIPDLYDKSDEWFYPSLVNNDSLQFIHVGNIRDYEIDGEFDLGILYIHPGKFIKNPNNTDGWAILSVPYGTGCSETTKYEYRISTLATFEGEISPAGLSEAELQKILDL